jgi:hypothetical protein
MAQSKKVKSFPYTLLLIGICLLFFIPFFLKPQLLSLKDNDLGRTYIPMFTFVRNSFLVNKSIPLWRGDQMMGESLVANPVSSLFYPANIIFLIFPSSIGAVIYYFLHFLIAALATFYLGRSFGLSKIQSFAAGLFYAFSTKILLHLSAGHITMVAAFSYFPLAFLAVRKLLEIPSVSWIVIAAVALAFVLICYPTIFYYACLFVFAYLAYYYLFNWQVISGRFFLKILSAVTAMFVFAILFAAIEFLPQLAFGPISTRSQLSYADVAIPLFSVKRYLTSLLFPYLDFKNLDHESFLYLGAIPTVLALFGFLKLSFGKKAIVAVLAVITVLFTLGQSTPVFNFAYHFLPLLKYSRVTTRIWFTVALVVALLAANALRNVKNQKLVLLIIGIFLIENFAIGYAKIFSVPNLNTQNVALYQYLASDKTIHRVYCTTYCFNPQLLEKYHIQILNGETPIQQQSFVSFLSRAGNYNWANFAVIFPPYQVWQVANPPQPDADLLAQANVKYVATTYLIQNPMLDLKGKFGDIYLYINTTFKPRAYFENARDVVDIEKYEPNRILVTFQKSGTPRKLIFSENYFPGWIASENFLDYKVEPYKNVFRSVTVLPGISSIEFKYQPQNFIIGKTVTIATFLFLLLFFWYIRIRLRRI